MYGYAIVRAPAVLQDTAGDRLVGLDGHPLDALEHAGLALLRSVGPAPTTRPVEFMRSVLRIQNAQACVPLRAEESPVDDRAATSLLRSGKDRFEKLLDLFQNAEEWSVSIPAAVSAEHPHEDKATGLGYLEKKKRDFALADGIDPGANDRAHELVQGIASNLRTWRVVSSRSGGASLVMLVERGQIEQVADALEAHDDAGALTLSGPWPPFSFTNPK